MTMHPDGNMDAVSPKVPPTTTTPPVGAGKTGDMENKTTLEGFGVSNIVQKWRRDDLLKKGSLSLCVASLIFSLIALIIMASNKHGDWKNYNKYEEYRYVLAIAIISTLYSGLQAILQLNDLSGRELILKHHKMILDFFGDQVQKIPRGHFLSFIHNKDSSKQALWSAFGIFAAIRGIICSAIDKQNERKNR
ncbi:hypothetical protein Leryth_023148 [Lithospermum erythrorhizon]|nr:hypothetical protein Leryth_023148 [Lithospermum erythrorhizon]